MAAKGIRVEVDQSSMNRVLNNLRKKGASVDPNVRRIIAETGLRVQADAKRKAPVLYGFLRSSIYLDINRTLVARINLKGDRPAGVIIYPSKSESDRDGLNFVVGSQMDYAGIREGLDPFLIPAFNKHAKDAEQAMDKLLKALVK